MNGWEYLNATPLGAFALVVAVGWTLARLVRAWRERRPVAVRLFVACPFCGREEEHGESDFTAEVRDG